MRKSVVICGITGILFGMILSGCTNRISKNTVNENEAEITLSMEDKEEKTTEQDSDFSRGDLLTMFEEKNNETVISFLYDDYNLDGLHEAFVITKDKTYKLWYMNAVVCELVNDKLGEVDDLETDIVSFKTKAYLMLQQKVDNVKNTLVYSVDNKEKVIQPIISGKGYLYYNQTGNLQMDVMKVDEDITSKATYYYYYLIDEGFKEYGGIPIGEEQFLEYEGAAELLEEIHTAYEGYNIEYSFLYRQNHYININLTLYNETEYFYKNITLKYDEHKISKVTKQPEEGKIETANMLEIATFPTAFKHPFKESISE